MQENKMFTIVAKLVYKTANLARDFTSFGVYISQKMKAKLLKISRKECIY